jgi:hypothetical protein
MTLAELKATLGQQTPPPGLPPAVRALWLDACGDWEAAHQTAQDIADASGAWVHAYLHRKEGDQGNAAYWYRRACKPVCGLSLPEEWEAIASVLLEDSANA